MINLKPPEWFPREQNAQVMVFGQENPVNHEHSVNKA
jgi:hypothetical protein